MTIRVRAIYIGKNLVFHERTKHIELNDHFTQDKILEGLIQLIYLPTTSELADVLLIVSGIVSFLSN